MVEIDTLSLNIVIIFLQMWLPVSTFAALCFLLDVTDGTAPNHELELKFKERYILIGVVIQFNVIVVVPMNYNISKPFLLLQTY